MFKSFQLAVLLSVLLSASFANGASPTIQVVSPQAATNIAIGVHNLTQFSSAGSKVFIKAGAPLTNIVVYGTWAVPTNHNITVSGFLLFTDDGVIQSSGLTESWNFKTNSVKDSNTVARLGDITNSVAASITGFYTFSTNTFSTNSAFVVLKSGVLVTNAIFYGSDNKLIGSLQMGSVAFVVVTNGAYFIDPTLTKVWSWDSVGSIGTTVATMADITNAITGLSGTTNFLTFNAGQFDTDAGTNISIKSGSLLTNPIVRNLFLTNGTASYIDALAVYWGNYFAMTNYWNPTNSIVLLDGSRMWNFRGDALANTNTVLRWYELTNAIRQGFDSAQFTFGDITIGATLNMPSVHIKSGATVTNLQVMGGLNFYNGGISVGVSNVTFLADNNTIFRNNIRDWNFSATTNVNTVVTRGELTNYVASAGALNPNGNQFSYVAPSLSIKSAAPLTNIVLWGTTVFPSANSVLLNGTTFTVTDAVYFTNLFNNNGWNFSTARNTNTVARLGDITNTVLALTGGGDYVFNNNQFTMVGTNSVNIKEGVLLTNVSIYGGLSIESNSINLTYASMYLNAGSVFSASDEFFISSVTDAVRWNFSEDLNSNTVARRGDVTNAILDLLPEVIGYSFNANQFTLGLATNVNISSGAIITNLAHVGTFDFAGTALTRVSAFGGGFAINFPNAIQVSGPSSELSIIASQIAAEADIMLNDITKIQLGNVGSRSLPLYLDYYQNAGLYLATSLGFGYTTIISNTAMTTEDLSVFVSGTTNIIYDLNTSGLHQGRFLSVANVGTASTIITNTGSGTFANGDTSITLSNQFQSVMLHNIGNAWNIIGTYNPGLVTSTTVTNIVNALITSSAYKTIKYISPGNAAAPQTFGDVIGTTVGTLAAVLPNGIDGVGGSYTTSSVQFNEAYTFFTADMYRMTNVYSPKLQSRFRLHQLTDCRFYDGFAHASATTFLSSDDPASVNHVALRYTSTGANLMFQTKNGGGTVQVSDTGVVATTNSVLWRAEYDSTGPRIICYIENVAVATNSTSLPLVTQGLYRIYGMETLAAATKGFTHYESSVDLLR